MFNCDFFIQKEDYLDLSNDIINTSFSNKNLQSENPAPYAFTDNPSKNPEEENFDGSVPTFSHKKRREGDIINCDSFIESTINKKESDDQDISKNEFEEFGILLSKKDNKFHIMNTEETGNKISKKENEFQQEMDSNENGVNIIQTPKIKVSQRGIQKDNFSIKLFKDLNDWILKGINSNKANPKIYTPNYDIFTHNSNLVDIFVFLSIKYKYLLCITPQDKEDLDQILIDLKIKKKNKKKKTLLIEKTNNYKDEKKVDDCTYKKDKDNNYPLFIIKKKEKKTRGYQIKNRNNLIDKEINLKDKDNEKLNMTLRELIFDFYKSPNEFNKFRPKVLEIDENFKKQKKNNTYSLLDKEYAGFIRMIEEDCNLNVEQKKKVKDFTDYFSNKELSVEELQKYREIKFQK